VTLRLCSIEKLLLVTGLPGSGKSIFGKTASRRGIPVINMGDIVREHARERGLKVTDQNLGTIATELRQKLGKAAIAIIAFEKACQTGRKLAVIEGLRSLEELDYFRGKVPKYVLVAFHASPSTRFKRLLSRGREDDPKTWEEFELRDRRELDFGIGSVIALADIMVVNENITLEQLSAVVENLLESIIEG